MKNKKSKLAKTAQNKTNQPKNYYGQLDIKLEQFTEKELDVLLKN